MARPVITLTTDFGTADPFVGAMKGVILGICPEATVVDLTHDVPPHDIHAGAYLLGTAYHHFPPGTVHVIVVDPGVGTERRAIVAASPTATFVCPDNGLLSHAMDREGAFLPAVEPFALATVELPPAWRCHHLTNERYWHLPVSNTFHGRDVFAPVAAHLAAGEQLAHMGPAIGSLSAFGVPKAKRDDGGVQGTVVHVDRFGNLVTNIDIAMLGKGGETLVVEVGGATIQGLSTAYQSGGAPVGVVGSNETLEIAVPNGDASAALGVGLGDPVRVRFTRT